MPARTTAPGSEISPPTTRTLPRASLSSSLDGAGIGHCSSSVRVTRTASALPDLFRGDFGIGFRCHRRTCFFERSDKVEQLEPQLPLGAGSGIVHVRCDGAIRYFVLL